VALEPTLINVAVLGLLVLIRTFLGWSLAVEIERRWPWQVPIEKDIDIDLIAEKSRSFDTTKKPAARVGVS
jgi:hypothetical protein